MKAKILEEKIIPVLVLFIFCLGCNTPHKEDDLITSSTQADGNRMIEIRSYNLKPGRRSDFHKLFLEQGLPMLKRWKVDVIAYGPSLHDSDSYFLIRAYRDLKERQQSEDAFYGSDEWKKGPREAVLALIVNYTTVVMPADSITKHYSVRID